MPSATFDFATIYMWMAASCVFFAALRMSLERWVLPLVWDWIKCKESDRLPPEGYGAGTLQDISVRCTSVFFSIMIVANSYSVLMNPQMQHFAARGLLPGMTGEADWTAGCSWEATHCDAHFWSAAVVGGYMLYDTLVILKGLEHEPNGALQTLAHHIIVLVIVPPGALHNAWCWVGTGLMTFCSEISGPSLQFIWILKAAGYSGHWLEAVNGVIFAVLFLFARVYVIGVVVWITFSELSDPFDLSSGPTNPFNSATAPDGGYFLQDGFLGTHMCGVLLGVGFWLISLTWVPAVVRGVTGNVLKFMGSSSSWAKASNDEFDSKAKAAVVAGQGGKQD